MYLWIIAAVAAYFIKGLCGFANTLVFTSILSFGASNANISPIDLLLGYPTNLILTWKNRKSLDPKVYLPLAALVLAGSIPASLEQTTYERILARLEGRGVRAVVDATRDLLVNVLRYRPFLIKPNNHELSEITGVKLTTDREIAAAAKMMQDKGARNVLVSMAGDGALLLDEQGGVHRIGCPKGKVVNSVGAGDSMVAGFVAGYQQSGGDYEAALRLGTACGSATAFSLGLATKADIDKLLKTME